MDSADQNEEHLDQAIALAMGGEVPAANPLGVEAPASIPIHDGNELPEDCPGQGNDLDGWTHPTKPTRDASADELTRHAQYLEWRAGILTGQAAALRSIAATR
jgi:hypothetical protein